MAAPKLTWSGVRMADHCSGDSARAGELIGLLIVTCRYFIRICSFCA